ncbi:MAG: hypothetical protein ACRCXT_00095 [Paraclostridium sp.]
MLPNDPMGIKAKILMQNSGINDYMIIDNHSYQYTPNGNVLVLGDISDAVKKELNL